MGRPDLKKLCFVLGFVFIGCSLHRAELVKDPSNKDKVTLPAESEFDLGIFVFDNKIIIGNDFGQIGDLYFNKKDGYRVKKTSVAYDSMLFYSGKPLLDNLGNALRDFNGFKKEENVFSENRLIKAESLDIRYLKKQEIRIDQIVGATLQFTVWYCKKQNANPIFVLMDYTESDKDINKIIDSVWQRLDLSYVYVNCCDMKQRKMAIDSYFNFSTARKSFDHAMSQIPPCSHPDKPLIK